MADDGGIAEDGDIPDTVFLDADDVNEPQRLPVNQNPAIFGIALNYIQAYGWFILIVAIVLYYVGCKFKAWYDRQSQHQQYMDNKKYDSYTDRQRHIERQEASRRRLQEEHDSKASTFLEQQKIVEEKKRQDRIEDWERHQEGRGYRSKYHPPNESETSNHQRTNDKTNNKTKKKPLRDDDYNPLIGDNSPSRPARRSGGGG